MSARRPTALVGAAIVSFAVLASTQVNARQKHNNNHLTHSDQHFVGASSAPQFRPRRIERRVPARAKRVAASPYTNRDCLDAPTRALLNNLEARFGRVALVKVCVPGARMPSGHVSWHARNKAFDFKVPKGVDQRDVMVWLSKHSPGVTISYRGALAGIVHTDTGTFKKVIYAAADHDAGHRAVAIWRERARLAALPPQRERKPAARHETQPAPWTATANYVEPDFEQFVHPPTDRAPEPIGPQDRAGIFRRYFETKEVVVRSHVTLVGVDPRLMRLVNDASSHFGRIAYINSGYRSPSYNRRVGGARNSQHTMGRAVDFRVAGVSPRELRSWIVARLDRWGIRGIGTYGSHLHADVRQATRLVSWSGGAKKRVTRYAKHRKPGRYASAG